MQENEVATGRAGAGFRLIVQAKPTRPEVYATHTDEGGHLVTGYGNDVYECLANAAQVARSLG